MYQFSVENVFGILIGFVFMFHGALKLPSRNQFFGWLESAGVPFPKVAGWLAILSELVGGALVVGDVAGPYPEIALIGTMLGAIKVAHWKADPQTTNGGWEYPAVLIGALTTLGWHDAITVVNQVMSWIQ